MKTAIFIPDEIFQRAEKVAKRLKLTRSKLFAIAIEAYIEPLLSDEVTRTLDEVYLETPSGLDSIARELQSRSLPPEKW